MMQRGLSAWGIQMGSFAAGRAPFVPKFLKLFASGHVVHHEPTCHPDTKSRDGGGGELKNLGNFIE